MSRALGRHGYDVASAASGAEGVAMAGAGTAQGGFDLVAVDHYMPGMDGLETLAAITALPDPPRGLCHRIGRGAHRRRRAEGRRGGLCGEDGR
ncbi:hypothetical protein GCM10020258_14150 [Sphingomonas yabuuchiae]